MITEINNKTNLSEHFTLGELTKTKTGISNVPNEEQVKNLRRLCGWLEMLLERSPKGGYWLHFAVRPTGNRRIVRLVQT